MFCPNCGRENAEKSLFCTYCGGKLDNVTAEPVSDVLAAKEQAASTSVQTAVKPDEAAAQSGGSAFAVPTPGTIPQSGEGVPFVSAASDTSARAAAPESAPAKTAFSAEVPLSAPAKPEKERRYFTAAHIAICLAVAGVMAAAAGVFAGLYFSAIL